CGRLRRPQSLGTVDRNCFAIAHVVASGAQRAWALSIAIASQLLMWSPPAPNEPGHCQSQLLRNCPCHISKSQPQCDAGSVSSKRRCESKEACFDQASKSPAETIVKKPRIL